MPLMEATGIKQKLLGAVEKLSCACATQVHPNSKGLEQFILKEGFAQTHKTKVIGEGSSNGIDTSYFDSEFFTEEQN
jgi:hypothetical protein